jgi:hypothetical protein
MTLPENGHCQLISKILTELQTPLPNSFVGYDDAPFGQYVLDIAVAQ